MNIDFLKRLLWFTVLIVVQVFVLNHIHLFAVATPLLYIYFILQLHRNRSEERRVGKEFRSRWWE